MLLSRVADALYWITRYLERAEYTVRVVNVRLDLGLDRRAVGWDFDRLYASLGMSREKGLPDNPVALIESVILDPSNPGSVAATVTAARENARQVREQISTEMWQHINELFLRLKQARTGAGSARPHYVSRLVIDGIHLFQGFTDATMAHGEGWQYMQAGRFIERAGSTAALLDRHLADGAAAADGSPAAQLEWMGLLRSCCALEGYCRYYTADLRRSRIAEFLLLNAEFPRSVRFAAAQVENALRAIAPLTGRPAGGQAERLAGRLHAPLVYGQIDEILQDPHAYLDTVRGHCAQVHSALFHSYISYRVESALPA
jgi:uncharacterized alpha-E superfamily protein